MGSITSPNSRSRLSSSSQRSVGRMGRGSLATMLGVGLSAAASFGVTVVITRGLDQDSAGVFFACTSLFLLAVSIGQLGTSTGLVYFLSRARTLGRPELLLPYLRAAQRPVIVASVLSAVALVACAPWIAAWVAPTHADTATTYLRVFGVFLPFATLKTLNLSASRGMGTMRPTVLVEQIGRPLLQFTLVTIVVLISNEALLPYAWALCFVVGAAGGRKLLNQRIDSAETERTGAEATSTDGPTSTDSAASTDASPSTTSRPVVTKVGREFWAFTGPRAIANVGQIAMQRFDIVLVAALAGPAAAAIYTATTRFLLLGQLGNRAVSLSAQPRLAEALALKVTADVNAIYRTSTAWLMMTTWPIYLLFASVGAPLLAVFGEGYGQGAPLLVVLSLAMLLATGCGMVDIVLNMAGRTSWNLINVVVALTVNLVLDIVLIPRIGIMGAALGWAAAIVVQNAMALAQIGFKEGLHPFGAATATVAVSAAVCFAGVPFALQAALGASTGTVLLGAGIGALLYVGTLWWFRHVLHLRSLLSGGPGRRRTRPTEDATTQPAADS